MPYTYDFFLLKRTEQLPEDYLNWEVFPKLDEPDKYPNFVSVRLNGEVTNYIWDYLEWVPCHWPHQGMKEYRGFAPNGPSVVFSNGAEVLLKVVTSLISLFALAPKNMKLHEGVSWTIDKELIPIEDITQNYLNLDRDTIVLQLEKLANIARLVSQDDSEYFIGYSGL